MWSSTYGNKTSPWNWFDRRSPSNSLLWFLSTNVLNSSLLMVQTTSRTPCKERSCHTCLTLQLESTTCTFFPSSLFHIPFFADFAAASSKVILSISLQANNILHYHCYSNTRIESKCSLGTSLKLIQSSDILACYLDLSSEKGLGNRPKCRMIGNE